MANAVREAIVLKDERTGTRFMFPVNPDVITVTDGRVYQDVPIINLGSTLLAGSMMPEQLQFASFFPKFYDASYCNYVGIEAPETSWERLLGWMGRAGNNLQGPVRPVRATITGTKFSQLMLITDLTREQQGGEPGDIYFQITLQQWRRQNIRIEERVTTRSSSTKDQRSTTPISGQTYKVVSGDTLQKIAKKFYNDSSKWPTIYNANRKIIGSNPNLIRIGQVLVIP